jgi:hypothetical protein
MATTPGIIKKEFKFSIVVNVLLLSTFAGVAAIFTLLFFRTEKFTKNLSDNEAVEFTESIVRVLGVIGGITSAVYVGQGLHFNVQKAKEDNDRIALDSATSRLNELATQWINIVPATQYTHMKILELEQEYGRDNIVMQRQAIKRLMEESTIESVQFFTSSKVVLDFVELIAVNVLNGSLPENETFQYFGVVVVRVSDLFKDYITHLNDLKSRKLAYRPLMELNKRWESKVP